MTEIIMGALLVVCATLLGNSFAQKLINRKNSLQGIIEAIEKMKTYISFSSMEITQVVSESFKNISGFDAFVTLPSDDVSFSAWWRTSVNNLGAHLGLDKEDKTLLLKFSDGIGASDIKGQISHLDLYTELFTERLKQAKEHVSSKSRLYRILGFSMGCAVTLIVV